MMMEMNPSECPIRRCCKRINRAWMKALLVAVGLSGATGSAFGETTWIGQFQPANGTLSAPWKVEQFDTSVAATRFQTRVWDGVAAVEAEARHSMSVLVRPINVNLEATPFLCWRWRVEASIARADIHTKAGDDYAARIYLMYRVADADLGFATRTKLALARAVRGNQVPDAAINYVWDNRSSVGTVVPNAYTDRAMMWVLRSGDTEANRWVSERRDVRQDFKRAFGYLPTSFYAVGLATDTDNTGSSAKAGFADLRLVSGNEPCTD